MGKSDGSKIALGFFLLNTSSKLWFPCLRSSSGLYHKIEFCKNWPVMPSSDLVALTADPLSFLVTAFSDFVAFVVFPVFVIIFVL